MSGWTTITFRGKRSANYDHAEYDESDPARANEDLVASLNELEHVGDVWVYGGHVYCYLNTRRYDFETAERIIEQCEQMIRDAVVIGANDTTDTGIARYYPVSDEWTGTATTYTDLYRETQAEDGCHVGRRAAAVMFARHGIEARSRRDTPIDCIEFYEGRGTPRHI